MKFATVVSLTDGKHNGNVRHFNKLDDNEEIQPISVKIMLRCSSGTRAENTDRRTITQETSRSTGRNARPLEYR